MNWVTALLITAVAGTLLFLGCTTENPASSSGSTLPAAQLQASAIIFETDGTNPAAGANVTFFEAGSVDLPPVVSLTADSTGRITVSDLPPGEYTLWAEKMSFVLYQKNVVIAPTFSTLRDDTLEFPSQLTLRASLQPFHDARSVTVRLAGSDRSFTSSTSQGWITLAGLAQGTYTLFLESSLPGYIPAERSVTLRASSIDSLHDSITLAYTGLAAVRDVVVRQDTVSGLITVSWGSPACRGIQDFVLFRKLCTDTAVPSQPFASTSDTIYYDRTYCNVRASQFDTARRCYTYYVVARDNLQQTGPVWNATKLTYAPKSLATTYFTNTNRWAGPTFSASIGDTAVLSVTAANKTRALRKIQWYDPSAKDTLATRSFSHTRSLDITDSLHHVFTAPGRQSMLAVVTDEAGTVWADTFSVWISGTIAWPDTINIWNSIPIMTINPSQQGVR
jgi:hypothetical protein